MQKLLLYILIMPALFTAAYGQKLSVPIVKTPGIVETSLDSSYTIKVANMIATIDAGHGARVTSLKLDEKEILGSKDLHPKFYGSSLWLSPEGKWKGQGVLDEATYTTDIYNGVDIKLISKDDSVRGFRFLKEFHADLMDTSLVLIYTITNISKRAQEVSPWEVTRVPTGGLAFFPKGALSPTFNSNLTVRDTMGMIYYPYDPSTKDHEKVYMHGREGWLAYVKDRTAFIKSFPVIAYDEVAPNEESVEMYANKQKTYLELENQGRYQNLQPNESLTYKVKWYARHLPDQIKPVIGNKILLEYIRSIVNAPFVLKN